MSDNIRSWPRVFVPGATPEGNIDLPSEELDKLRKVLRLSPGATVAVLPNDGTLVKCELLPKAAKPLEVFHPETEPKLQITLAQSLPKGDKLDEIIRACTEIGVVRFILFPSDRTVVQWDDKKTEARVKRLQAIAREAAEVSFRTRLPDFEIAKDLIEVLNKRPQAVVLSEAEGLLTNLAPAKESQVTLLVGPEGGWSPKELALIGGRGVTLGPRVLRVDHAGFAAAAFLLTAAQSL